VKSSFLYTSQAIYVPRMRSVSRTRIHYHEHYGIVTDTSIGFFPTQIDIKFKSSESFSGDDATFTSTFRQLANATAQKSDYDQVQLIKNCTHILGIEATIQMYNICNPAIAARQIAT
jgi:hypothetical protein